MLVGGYYMRDYYDEPPSQREPPAPREPPYQPPQHSQPPIRGRPQYRSSPFLAIIIIGIIIIMVGGIISACWGFIEDPDDDSDSDDREEYSDSIRILTSVGNLTQYIGIMILAIGLILGAVKETTLHPNIRLGMLIAMGLVIGFKIFYPIFPFSF